MENLYNCRYNYCKNFKTLWQFLLLSQCFQIRLLQVCTNASVGGRGLKRLSFSCSIHVCQLLSCAMPVCHFSLQDCFAGNWVYTLIHTTLLPIFGRRMSFFDNLKEISTSRCECQNIYKVTLRIYPHNLFCYCTVFLKD